MKPNISIIIPVYNAEKTIKRCIESLLKQTYKYFQIIIVDDGSIDKTAEILKEYKSINNIIIIKQPNRGPSIARNKGLKYADTKYVAFVDADDYVEDDFLSILLNGYCYKNIDLSVIGYNELDENNNLIDKSIYTKRIMNSSDYIAYTFKSNGPKGYMWNKLWKKDIIKRFDIKFNANISMAEDLLFCIEYLVHVNKIYISNSNSYNYMQSAYSLSNGISLKIKDNHSKKRFSDYIFSLKEILSIIPKDNVNGETEAKIELCNVTINFLRWLNLYDKEDINLKKELRKEILKLEKIFIRNKEVRLKTKIACVLVLYFPSIIRLLDRQKNN
ncbi:hypothetical protein CXB72_09325 [Lactobacillus acidophilus]|uniref:glycosyltransferase family 2 protein n=1 Tax=Lactobacillus acidophilus TaxID=1579 RepID=UPI000F753504|nr:glycosyltransferase family 2 protein [Lactobacillus acidophilus]AZN77302.1 hypothetical protein CXB72_09325 [Lactobacillus acidophilus]